MLLKGSLQILSRCSVSSRAAQRLSASLTRYPFKASSLSLPFRFMQATSTSTSFNRVTSASKVEIRQVCDTRTHNMGPAQLTREVTELKDQMTRSEEMYTFHNEIINVSYTMAAIIISSRLNTRLNNRPLVSRPSDGYEIRLKTSKYLQHSQTDYLGRNLVSFALRIPSSSLKPHPRPRSLTL
jgi:hypothetical protein